MQEIRAFIALELPVEIKSLLSGVLGELAFHHQKAVKWVNPDGIHLTLKFLGNIPPSKVSPIADVMAQASRDYEVFDLELKGLGAFPNVRSPRVVWVGIGGDIHGVVKLQKQIDGGLAPLGFAPEKRAFSPHLTLGRVREKSVSKDRQYLVEALPSVKIPRISSFRISRISLMKSTLTRSGAIYEPLAGFSLDRIRDE